MITLSGITTEDGNRTRLSAVSFSLNPGEFVCFAGPSGSGKSSLLNVISGMEQPTHGKVLIDDVAFATVPKAALRIFRKRLGIIYQDQKLNMSRTIAENIALSLEIMGRSDVEVKKRVGELLKSFGLEKVAGAFPKELSAGERQRVAIARAIAHEPLILIADEPFQNLDAKDANDALASMKELHTRGTTVIVATANAALAQSLGARVIELSRGKVVRDTAVQAVATEKQEPPKVQKVTDHHETVLAAVTTKEIEAVKTRRKVKVTAIHSE